MVLTTDAITIRGGKQQAVVMLAARLYVKMHKARRYVIALKYEGETDYRYLVASNVSWRQDDIAQFYTLRWLIEVFIQDWKTHGWSRSWVARRYGITEISVSCCIPVNRGHSVKF